MKTLSYSQIHKLLDEADLLNLPSLHISVIRNIMLEPIEPYLRYLSYQIGFNAKVRFGEYDNIFQEAVGGNEELLNKVTDCVFIFMNLETISWDLSRKFTGLSSGQVNAEVRRIQDFIANVIVGIRHQSDAMILWHGLEFPINPGFGIWDSQMENGQLGVIRELNAFLRDKLSEIFNAYLVDSNLCLIRVGAQNFYDFRYWHIGRAPYSREALQEIAFEDFKYVRALKGKNKKCLVLDCDNTLWGGIIGEDGLSGIKLGKTYPGSSYYEFQQEIVNLHNRGIIIALCSKNNEKDVWEVFQQHPDMVLREEHIATAQINWNDKAANLRQIALDLNIGLDSIVFMDDSEFEVNLIRDELPEVETIHLYSKRAVEYTHILSSCGLFDTLTVSEEDKKRGAMYKSETDRKKLMTETADMVTYFKSLEMVLDVRFASYFSISRIAQQTQKTNQFNLTTRRYNDADINALCEADDSDVVTLTLKDKFGDSGIVGTCILKYEDKKAIFDSFLLSCRVLGRGVEDAFVIQALKLAKKRGCEVAIGEYYSTSKNAQVEHFFSKQGFKEMKVEANRPEKRFEYDLNTELGSEPEFFKEISSEID